ncbi:DUF4179 domain-containing protein [Paenibacillus sp. CN-4]|uniref:DUF4179 domain-containing protein n=1 Tax=Paenibacillus nanchangensis TaxID=3348343 RepID=UPI00397CC4E5
MTVNHEGEELRALLRDARDTRRERDEVPQDAIMRAVQKGMLEGNRRRKTSRLASAGAVLLTAAVVAAGLFMNSLAVKPPVKQTAGVMQKDWGTLAPLQKILSSDLDRGTIRSAVDNGYMQVINQSAEQNGFKITVLGAAADGNKFMIFYTAETDDSKEMYSVSSVKIKNALTGKDLGQNSSGLGGHDRDDPSNQRFIGRTSIELQEGASLPERIEADFQLAGVDRGKLDDPDTGTKPSEMRYSPRLKVAFTLDPKFSEAVTETVHPEASVKLGKYRFSLAEVRLSPLETRVEIEYEEKALVDWETKLAAHEELNPDSIIAQTGTGVVELNSLGGGGTDKGYAFSFSSAQLDQPESLTLRLHPGQGPREEQLITVDLANRKVIRIPKEVGDAVQIDFDKKGQIIWRSASADGQTYYAASAYGDAHGKRIELTRESSKLDTGSAELEERLVIPADLSERTRINLVVHPYVMLKIK